MNECPVCRSELEEGARQCPACGSQIAPAGPAPRLNEGLQRRYLDGVNRVQMAELAYHGALVAEFVRHQGRLKRRSLKHVSAAFRELADAVISLQAGNELLKEACAAAQGAWDTVCDAKPDVAWAETEYAGFLGARSGDELSRALENRGPFA